ncbi:catenin delta-2-like isoform X2 [Petromyzon marinus]|uniref:Catenin delta-2-like isoform X2 n=1 Tax=Petromyzon marinus TaxID=7757 RepID=A0AAJ7T963_PETMA|nr:catenin delta-2-like isoform X2 [Petromyzon marinus]
MPVAEAHAQPSAPSRPQDGGGRETSAEPGSKERTKEGSGRERDGSMEPHNTSTILATVKEQELQFERLTRELEAERLIVASQLERCKLQESETASMSSIRLTFEDVKWKDFIRSTDDSFHWRTSDGATGELSEDEGRVSVGSELVDSCLRALQERGLFEGPDPLHRAVSSKLNSSPDSCYQETGSYQTSSHTGAQSLSQTLAGGGFQAGAGAQATAAPEDSGSRTMLTRSLSAQQHQPQQQQNVYTQQQQQQQRGDRAHAYTQLMRMYDLKTRGNAERDYETFAPKRSASLPPNREPPYGTVIGTHHGTGHSHGGMPRSAHTLVHVPYGSPGPGGASPAQRADMYVGKRAAAPSAGSGNYYWLSYRNTRSAAPMAVGSPNHASPASSAASPLAGPAAAYSRSSSQSPPLLGGYGNSVASSGGAPPSGSVMTHHHHHHHHQQQVQQQQQQLARSSSPSSQASPAKRTPGGSDRQSPERVDRQRPGSLSGLRGSYSSQQGAATEVRYVTSPDRLITPIYEDQVYRSPESATHTISRARSPPDYAVYSTAASSAVHRSSSQRSSRSGPGGRQRSSHSASSHTEPGAVGLARRPSGESVQSRHLMQPDGRLRRSTSSESLQKDQGELGWRDPDLLEVIQMLQHNLPSIQGNAAAYLQHLCYRDSNIKTEVRRLGGIPLLVDLLGHPKADVQKNACGSLKNLVYGNDDNKKALRQAGGVPALATLLRRTGDAELQELATGLLWNLSSCETLKMAMVTDALSALVASVVVPCAGLARDGESASAPLASPTQGIQSQVLRNATGCLRNMSSAGEEARRQMRECDGLVESLLHIIETCLDTEDVGGKVVENCVCVLRNLSYRLAAETLRGHDWASGGGSGGGTSAQDGGAAGPGGGGGAGGGRTGRARQKEKPSCWGKKRKKKPLDEWDGVGPIPECPDPPRGPERLFHPSVVNPYLGLLKKCANPATLEGAAGALQNLAAGGWKWSKYVRAMVRREKGLPVLVELLRMDSDRVVCAVATALRNMAMDVLSKELIGKYAMRDLVQRLPEPVTNNSIASGVVGGSGGGGGGMVSGTSGDETPGATASAALMTAARGAGGNGNNGHGEMCASEDTVAAVCCALNEVTTQNMENAKALRDAGGIERLVHVTRGRTDRVDSLPKDKSRMYASDTWTSSNGFSPKVVKAAAQVLSTLWQYRDLRALYKKDGWSQQHFLVLSTMERERNKPRAVSQPASPTRATAAIRSQSVGSALSTARDTSSFRESRRSEYEAVRSSPSHRSNRPELPVRRDSSRGLPPQPCAGTYRSSYASQNVEDQSHTQTTMRATLAERQRRGDPSRRDYEAVYWTARPVLPGANDSFFDERLHFAGDACGTHARHPPPGTSANYVEFYSTRRAVAHAAAAAPTAAAATSAVATAAATGRGNYDSLHYRDATDSWV